MDRRAGTRADVIPISDAPSAPGAGSATATRLGAGAPADPAVGARPGGGGAGLAQPGAGAGGAPTALTLSGSDDPAPVSATGGTPDDGLGTSAVLVVAAARRVDQGHGVAVLSDLGSAVTTVLALLADADEHGLPFPVRFADAPFVEGAVAAVVTATAGGDLAAVLDAAEETYRQHKTGRPHL
ncbi:PTS-dependent dihydroxyacetone kinase phosphotransferase subunit DhaM [Kitasatospora arboriphila]